jgi:hypothetical protein
MEFGQQFRNFRRELDSFTCPKAGTWDRLFYFPSEGRHAVDFFDFSSRKNLTASVSMLTPRPPKPLVSRGGAVAYVVEMSRAPYVFL